MKRHTTLAFLVGMILLFGIIPTGSIIPVSEDLSTDSISTKVFITDHLKIEVPTNQVAFYKVWRTDDNKSLFKVHFDNMFEIKDNNNNSGYDQTIDNIIAKSVTPLAQMVWEVSDAVNITENGITTTSFNLTGFAGSMPNPNVDPDLVIQFRNHIITTENNTVLKFDVVINNYTWKNDENSTFLVLGYKIEEYPFGNHEGPKIVRFEQHTRAQFGNAYLDSVPNANNMLNHQFQNQINASLSIGDSDPFGLDTNPRIFITYEHFTGDLVHDPTIGVDANEKLFTADELSLKVPTDQVPFYFFWRTGNEDEIYRVHFDTLFEVIDENNNDVFDPETEQLVSQSVFPLALMNWELSEIIEETNGENVIAYHFNLTGSPGTSPQVGDVYIQFRNHILVDGNDSSLKFDIVINNYDWEDEASNTILVLGYKLTSTANKYDGISSHNNSAAVFGDAYMKSTQTAFANNGTDTNQVRASLSIGEGSKVEPTDNDIRIYVSYTHFDGNLTHDPTLGLLSTTDIDGDTTTDEDEIIGLTFGIIILSLIGVIPVIRRKITR